MRLSVSGKIIKEISEKIPSTTYAIVELIKIHMKQWLAMWKLMSTIICLKFSMIEKEWI